MTANRSDFQGSHHSIPWYFVCSVCAAKWFAEAPKCRCPRCGTLSTSDEKIEPPWWRFFLDKSTPSTTAGEDHSLP